MLFAIRVAAVLALASATAWHAVDPLTAEVDDGAAQRFARVWRASSGTPTATQLRANYLENGGRGIEVFTPHRIVNAEHLAATIAQKPEIYRDAVERCLPWVADTNPELRSVYLGLQGLFPNRPLPHIAVVVGANNSGGTAAPGVQVIGLEVICRLSPTRAAFEARMRQFFAHETVHTFQQDLSPTAQRDRLVAQALIEGVPDYVTELVTAHVPDAARDEWARGREAWIWRQFQADAAIVRAGTNTDGDMTPEAEAAFERWFANAGHPPPGWPSELGYWVGMRIAESYVAVSDNPHAALDQLLDPIDPAAIITESGYGSRLPS